MTNEEAIKILKKARLAGIVDVDINRALDMAIKALEQTQLDKAYNKILKHFEEVKRLTIDEFNNCNRLGNEGFRKRGFIEATMYFEEYVKNLKEGAE